MSEDIPDKIEHFARPEPTLNGAPPHFAEPSTCTWLSEFLDAPTLLAAALGMSPLPAADQNSRNCSGFEAQGHPDIPISNLYLHLQEFSHGIGRFLTLLLLKSQHLPLLLPRVSQSGLVL